MWRSWAFFFFWSPHTPKPNRLWLTGSPAHRLTGSLAHRLTGSRQAAAKPSQGFVSGKAMECYFQNVFCGGGLWIVTSKRYSFWKGLFLICQTAFPNGKPFVCNIPKPFQRENTLSPAHRLKPSRSQAEPGICFWKGFGMLLTKGFLFGNAFFIFRCPGP